jgi:hypothetical protein
MSLPVTPRGYRAMRASGASSSAIRLAALVTVVFASRSTEKPLFASENQAASKRAQIEFFEKQIRPVLVEKCYSCHSAAAKVVQGGLKLDTAAALRAGGDNGPAIVPGDVEKGLLLDALRWDSFEMPPDGKLPDDTIKAFERWIAVGAPDPRTDRTGVHAEDSPEETLFIKAADHWGYQKPVMPAVPAVKNGDWPQSPIDRFVLAKLESHQMRPSSRVDRRTLIRRVYFDLVGLPPTYQHVENFVADKTPDAYEKLVDQLLASEQFGERWGRHWLDVARYADTKGYVFREDRNYRHAYRYRDWVINAFNRDLPYDEFLKLQLAADQIVASDDGESLAAMGFLTLGRRFLNRQPDVIDDRIDVVSRGLMGLTVTCARCHDHKYDPIPIEDYYSLYGVFASSEEPGDEPAPMRMVDREQPIEPVVFLRGNPRNRGERVPRQFLAALSGDDRRPFASGSGRLELAEKIASPENPLTARVWVNRVWRHLFGSSLVSTPSDFGMRCDEPTHPRLLDYLAVTFVEDGWSTKRLIRRIVLSSVYQQSSHGPFDQQVYDRCADRDPENRLLWRMNRRRLDFEATRDAQLFAAAHLDKTRGGPSVEITKQPFSKRRGVYAFIERQNLPGVFRTFDFASPDLHSPKRPYTTVPQQALFMMNGPFVQQQAIAVAGRTEVASAKTNQDKVRQIYRAILSRDPSDAELALASGFLDRGDEPSGPRSNDRRWRYGFGSIDEAADKIESFTPLPHFTGSAWQGGEKLPDKKIGWVILNANGGHPGDGRHAAIRRFSVPGDGRLSIRGTLKHNSQKGDGVQGRVFLNGQGAKCGWPAHHEQVDTAVELDVKTGDTVDFVTDCRRDPSYDGFQWTCAIELRSSDEGALRFSWSEEFAGPAPPALTPLQRLAQTLLMTNEFVFID